MGAPCEPASLVTTLGGDQFNRADGQTDSPVAPRPRIRTGSIRQVPKSRNLTSFD